MPIAPGAHLGRYEIRSKLGAGGMGEVYLALDTSELARTVALKILPADFASEQRRMQRFIQEAKTVSALNHPNILTIYEFGQAGEMRFIATEFVDGETLRQHLSSRRLKLSEVLEIAVQVAAALDAAHEAKIVHRDIKPENVMVRRRDHIVKVLDFGLAKLKPEPMTAQKREVDSKAGTKVLINTEPGLVLGTVQYMSPEQSQGAQQIDHRTDIWSLGVVLYEMVTGRLPFEGKDAHRQIIAIQEAEPPPLSRYVEDAPERLEEIVQKALAKETGERYQTAKDLLIDLRNLKRRLDVDAEIERTVPPEMRSALSGTKERDSPVAPATNEQSAPTVIVEPARPTSSAESVAGEIRRHKRGVIALAALILVTIIAGMAGLYLFRGKKAIDSIAVLPFANTNNDPNTEYLSDGITESIINSLTRLPSLRVIIRSTVFRYKGPQTDPLKAGRDLGVSAVLTGKVLQLLLEGCIRKPSKSRSKRLNCSAPQPVRKRYAKPSPAAVGRARREKR